MPASAAPPARLYEQALTLSAMGLHEEALAALRGVTESAPNHADAWLNLAGLLRLAGKDKEADAAVSHAAAKAAAWPPALDRRTPTEIESAERAMRERVGKLASAPERLNALRSQLRSHETDAAAMRLLARLEWRSGEPMTARALLERALVLAPDYEGAQADLAQLLQSLDENSLAAIAASGLVARTPTNAA